MAYEEYKPYLPVQRDKRVLDIGCGEGGILIFLKEQGFTDVQGVDIDKEQIERCGRRGIHKAELTNDLGEFLKRQRPGYELIVLRQVLYYFSEEQLIKYLELMHSLLSHGGIMIVEVFNGAQLTGHYIKDKDYKIKRVFTENSLKAVLNDAGFEVVAMFGNQPKGRTLKNLLWRAAQNVWFLFVHCIYILERGLDPNNPKILSKSIIAIAKR